MCETAGMCVWWGKVRSCGHLEPRVSKPLEPLTDSGGEGGGVREAEEKARKSAERCRLKPVGCHVRSPGRQGEDGLGTDDQRR